MAGKINQTTISEHSLDFVKVDGGYALDWISKKITITYFYMEYIRGTNGEIQNDPITNKPMANRFLKKTISIKLEEDPTPLLYVCGVNQAFKDATEDVLLTMVFNNDTRLAGIDFDLVNSDEIHIPQGYKIVNKFT